MKPGEGKKKRKSAALIRCRPIGRACPRSDGRGGGGGGGGVGRDAANISFWKTSSADWSWLSLVSQTRFYCTASPIG